MPLKKLLIILILPLFALTPAAPAAPAAEKPPLNVAVSDDASIISHRIISAALKRMGYAILLTSMGLRTALAETDSGDADVLAELVEGLEVGYDNIVRVPVSFSSTRMMSFVRADSKLAVRSWEDMRNLRIGCRWQHVYLVDTAPKYASRAVVAATYEELWQKLLDGELDVVVMPYRQDSGIIVPGGVKHAGMFKEFPNYPYVNKKYAHLVPQLSVTLSQMLADGTIEGLRKWSLSPGEKNVLHITSYSSEMAWERDVVNGLRAEIMSGVSSAAIFRYNLNSRRVQNKAIIRRSVAGSIHAAILERRPDVVIASDNDALEFARDNYYRLFADTPIIFCGINYFTLDMLRGLESAFTGATESISVSATVQYMLRLYPRARKIYVINDYSTSGLMWQKDIKAQLSRLDPRVEVEYNENMPKERLLQKLASFGEDVLVLLGSYFTDSDNVYTTEGELQRELTAILRTPLFVLISSYMGNGAFGGMLADGQAQGRAAGKMAVKVLEGVDVQDIPIIYASESLNKWIFDASVARKFGIAERQLPEGHTLINAENSTWENDSWRQGAAVMAFALALALVPLLIIYIVRKRHAAALAGAPGEPGGHENGRDGLAAIIRQLEGIMQKAPFAFAAVQNGHVLESNEYSRNKIGMYPGDRIHDFYKNPANYEKAVKTLEDQDSVSGEITLFNMADGETHRHHVNYVSVERHGQKGCLAFAIDIEELERQKDYTRRYQEDLKKILDAMPTGMAVLNSLTGELEYANRGFLGFYGYTCIEEVFPDDFQPLVEQTFAAWQGETIVFEYKNRLRANVDLHLKMYADQIIFRGRNCIALIAQDITAETRQAEMLSRAASKEKEANMLKSIFLANMSHEIRTPMNAIIGLSQLALMKEQSDENRDLFHKIRSSAKNLLSIINDILDFSKIEAEKMDFVEDVFSLEETIINAFLVATERLEDKKLEILLDLAPDVPYFLVGDNTRLWQVLKNLLDNSVKYTPSGLIILSISVAGASQEAVTLTFHIKDTGIGMTPDQIERLFTPFEQFHRKEGKRPGTGLGMSITKKLLDIMGGEIKVQSRPGEGSDFYVTIPFKRANNHKTMGDSMREILGGRAGRMNSILLVDDDEHSLMIMASILKHVGLGSACARNSAEALALIREHAEKGAPFSVTILDYMLGGDENGIDLARKINEISQNTKLLLVTAYLRRIIPGEVLAEVGFKDVIEKPYVVSTFLRKVCSVLPEMAAPPETRLDRYPNARVLLCEDNDINQQVACGLLEHFGITPVVAADGAEALDILERQSFDLILMDIMMPVMNGRDATKSIRQSDKPYKNVPIVAMTANVMVDEVALYLSEGMNAHLEKPIDIEKFQDMLAVYLGDGGAGREAPA